MAQTSKFGNTSSAIAYAVQTALDHNIRILLITTAFNDHVMKDCFWKEQNKSSGLLGIFRASRNEGVEKNGIEGIDRMLRSNRISPEAITDYTEIVLRERLEILPGIIGNEDSYNDVKERYWPIINLASQYYDMVVVDLDRKIGIKGENEILKNSDIIVAMVSQRIKEIENVKKHIAENENIDESKVIMAIGRYMDKSKYNARNITRTVLKQRNVINVIPYNNLFFEASQDARVINLFMDLKGNSEKDENYIFVEEIQKLNQTVKGKRDYFKMQGR